MQHPKIKLEEQYSDLRSDQIAYKLTIENPDTRPIRLISVDPKVPHGVSLLEITDSSLAEANSLKASLIDELNILLRQILLVTSEDFRRTWVNKQRASFEDILKFKGFLTPWKHSAQLKREFSSISFIINSSADADEAYDRWIKNVNEFKTIRELFQAKTEQLKRIENRTDSNDQPGLTSIEAGSFFTSTYVLKFNRGLLEPKKYQVGFNTTFVFTDTSVPQSFSTATNVQISPYPIILSIVAILASLLGVLVKISLGGENSIISIINHDLIYKLYSITQSGEIFVGPILALIFFNIYEYTSIGKRIGISVSWRSALLIGSLCGLAQNRIIEALKSLLGM